VVVEGYFDCFSLHRVGVTRAVATLGTALTPEHARLLKRRIGADGRVVLCYDADAAGRRAAAAGARVLLETGIAVVVAPLPPGTDPDDVVRSGGEQAIAELLARPLSLVEFLVEELPAERSARQRAAAELAGLVGSARDPHLRNEMLWELRERIGFSEDVLRDLARRAGRGAGPGSTAPAARAVLAPGELLLVRIALDGGPRWRRLIAEQVDPELRNDPRVGRLVTALRRFEIEGGGLDREFVRWLQVSTSDDDELLTLVAEVSTGSGPELTDDGARRQLERVLIEQWRVQARRLTAAIRSAEDDGDVETVTGLQEAMRELRNRRPDL
jgi:DNA primase